MKRLMLILIILIISISIFGCKSKKKTDDGWISPDDGDRVPGDDFDFYGDGVDLGGEVTVAPAPLYNLKVRFHYDFLQDIAEEKQSWPTEYSMAMRIDGKTGSYKISNYPYQLSSSSRYWLPLSLINKIMNSGKGNYDIEACDGGYYGDSFCSGRNRINYLGEENSDIFTRAPASLGAGEACMTLQFTLYDCDYMSLNNFYSGSYFSQIKVYRVNSHEEVNGWISFVDPYQNYCRVYVDVDSPTYEPVKVQVRDYLGQLSPKSDEVECD